MSEVNVEWVLDSVEEAWYAWERLVNAKGALEQASAMMSLADKMSDLATYHPKYDSRTGGLPYDD